MKNALKFVLIVLVLVLPLTGCRIPRKEPEPRVIAPLLIEPEKSGRGVDEFLEKLSKTKELSPNVEYFNVLPKELSELYGFELYECSGVSDNYIFYDGEIYELEKGFWSISDPNSMALADIDGNGAPELYYIWSWGSGMSHTYVAYFDFLTQKSTTIEYFAVTNKPLDLVVEDGHLKAATGEGKTEIIFKSGKIVMDLSIYE